MQRLLVDSVCILLLALSRNIHGLGLLEFLHSLRKAQIALSLSQPRQVPS
jgi:hypothetical protein